MKISVTNLGAIKAATVELGGLTVFVGPNGTGKSYLAMVVYGLLRSETIVSNFSSYGDRLSQILFNETPENTEQILRLLRRLTPARLNQAIPAIANLHAELLQQRLADFFNDDSNLFVDTKIAFADLRLLPEKTLQELINHACENIERPNQLPLDYLMGLISGALFWPILQGAGNGQASYFPAARSNFMLTFKEIIRARAHEQVGSAPMTDMLWFNGESSRPRKSAKLIRFDQPTEDFLNRLYDLDSAEIGPLAAIAERLQNNLYQGEQLAVVQAEGALADFRYRLAAADHKLRLHLSSSMVTETSPLLLGLRHWIQPNSLMIIDEPESHLHPQAQRALVSALAEAVNQGLRVILITHSPYILACVNNLIKFSQLIKQFPENAEVQNLQAADTDMTALTQKVCAYHFGRDGLVQDIVRASGLIDEAEFTAPFDEINAIYEAMRDIEWEQRDD